MFSLFLDEGKKLHFVSPARRKSVLAPILNKIKSGTDGSGNTSDTERKSNGTDSTGHISVQIEPAKRVKVSRKLNKINKIKAICDVTEYFYFLFHLMHSVIC